MGKERMSKLARQEALRRYENSARTVEDFEGLSKMYDDLDALRERRERRYEIGRREEIYEIGYSDGAVIPPPICHPYWKEQMRGEFVSSIFDSSNEIWQVFGDWQVGRYVKELTEKQREALFLSAVRLCTTEQIACYTDKTVRGVNRLIAAALQYIRIRLAERIRERIINELPVTPRKRQFLERYDGQKETPGDNSGKEKRG